MYIIKNAVKNLGRNKGRNILLALIIFAIILTTVVSIIINATTNEIISDYKTRFGSAATIDYDYDMLTNQEVSNFSFLTLEQYLEFSKSDYVKETIVECVLPVILKDIQPAASNGDGTLTDAYVSLTGTTRAEISSDFTSKSRTLKEGEVFKEPNECIISEQLAAQNNLSVGDSFTVYDEQKKNMQTLTITGIFEDLTMAAENKVGTEYSSLGNRNNEILTGIETINQGSLLDMDYRHDAFYVIYTLKDPAMLEDFTAQLREKGLPDYYRVTTDETSYQNIVGPVEAMADITNMFLIVVLVLGGVILVVLSTFSIRERKYEIGVLRAIGMKKVKVAAGLLVEMIAITALCLVVGLGTGAAVSQPVANSLLNSQVEIASDNNRSNSQTENDVFSRNNNSLDRTPLSEIDIQLKSSSIVSIILIALLLTVLSSISGIWYITKLEPMKILSERN